MRRNVFYAIPLFLIAVALQLTFFWLAPDVKCKWIVYCIGTIMTLSHLFLVFYLGSRFGTRRSAATVVAGTVIQAILLIASAALLIADATPRNAIFMLVIISVFYIAIVTSLALFIEGATEPNDTGLDLNLNENLNDDTPSYRNSGTETRCNENNDRNNGTRRVGDVIHPDYRPHPITEVGRRNYNPPPLPRR